MALTMTRTRTQTALNKLAQHLAEVNDELNLCGAVLEQAIVSLSEADQTLLQGRIVLLRHQRQALHVTLKQFDPDIEPGRIGTSRQWLKSKCRTAKCLHAAYLRRMKSYTQTL
jgi:hypothetical protein